MELGNNNIPIHYRYEIEVVLDIKFVIKYLVAHVEPQHIVLITITWLAFSIYSKVKKNYIRTNKLIQIAEKCPSLTRNNVAWLLDDSRNSQPPDKSQCEFLHCKRNYDENTDNKIRRD